MRRRTFIAGLGGVAVWPLVARGQVSPKRPLIAWLSGLTQTLSSTFVGNFQQGMQELGYIEARNFDMVYRFSEGYQERLPALAEELVRLKPNIIIATAVVQRCRRKERDLDDPDRLPGTRRRSSAGINSERSAARG